MAPFSYVCVADPLPISKSVNCAMSGVDELRDDQDVLVNGSISSDEDSDYSHPTPGTPNNITSKWWFQEPAVKKNCCVVTGAWILLILGVMAFFAGIVLEIVNRHSGDIIVRGFIFFLIGILLLIPSVYVVTHVYLAAKRVGRVRFSSVWFFR